MEETESLSIVTCNASSSVVTSVVVYEMLNDTELLLVNYKAKLEGTRCETTSSLHSCFYDDVTVTLRVLENLANGETKRYKCKVSEIHVRNAGNPTTTVYYINITKDTPGDK